MKKVAFMVVAVLLWIALPVSAQQIAVRYCDTNNPEKPGSTSANILLSEDQQVAELCVRFINPTDQEKTFAVSFVDGEKNGESIRCQESDDFAKYVDGYAAKTLVPAKTNIDTLVEVALPKSRVGSNYGCLKYYEDKTADGEGASMSTRLGYSHPITVYVDYPVTATLNWDDRTQSSLFLSGEMIWLQTAVDNNGDLDQKVGGSVVLKQNFGEEETIILPNFFVEGGAILSIELPLTRLESDIVKASALLSLEHQAIGNLKSEYIDEAMLKTQTITQELNFLRVPVVYQVSTLGGVLVLLLVVFFVWSRKRELHELQRLRKIKSGS